MTYESIDHAARAVAFEIISAVGGSQVFITPPGSRGGFANRIRRELARLGRLDIVRQKDDVPVAITGESFGDGEYYVHLTFGEGSGKNMFLDITHTAGGAPQ